MAGLLAVAVCAVLAGASSFAAITDWLHDLDDRDRSQLGFAHGVPVGTTVWRLLTRLDADLLTTVLAAWLGTRAQEDFGAAKTTTTRFSGETTPARQPYALDSAVIVTHSQPRTPPPRCRFGLFLHLAEV